MSHVTKLQELCRIYEWVMWHACMMYEWVMSHMCMSRVTHINELCHTWVSVWCMLRLWIDHAPHRDPCATNSFICVTRLMHIYDMTHSYIVWCMLRLWIGHVNYLNGSCQKYKGVVSHVCEWGMSDIDLCVVCVPLCGMSRVWMSHVTYLHEPCRTYKWVTHVFLCGARYVYEWVVWHI